MTQVAGPGSPDALVLFEEAACGLMQTSDDGTFLRVNGTFCHWVGRTADELVGKRRFQDLLTMGGRIFHQTHWSPLLRMQGTVSEVKLEVMHADGTIVPMVVNAIRRERSGVLVHDIAAYVARDRDTYERELIKARKEATHLHEEAKDRAVFAEQMIGIVSHDLRNPISAIMLATEVLGQGELSPVQQRTVKAITRAAHRATRLIADLLDFTQARVGAGMSCTPMTLDVHDVIGEAVEELRLAYPERELRHVRSGEGRCEADASRLAQLVGNLVSNAMTYGRRDAPVTVTTACDDGLKLTVHNEGPAIPESVRATIFDAMTRGASTSTGGVGLGLFIVREIAKAHGGTVEVRSEERDGTTFTVTLPRR